VGFYIYQFLPIVLIESLVLWRLRWGSYKLSLFDALLMNFASFIGLLLGLGPYIASTGPWGLTLFGTYSTMVQGTVLMLLERHAAKKVWLCVFVANLITCVALLGETALLHFHSGATGP
jgi:hypothetical protein